jgi:hypothetical protein
MGYNGTVPQLFLDFKKTYNSIRREVLDGILTVKLVWLIKNVSQHLSDACPI